MELQEVLQLARQLPGEPTPPELIQTHISYVLLGEAWVYKLKKPVEFGFLDFSTRELRRRVLDQELLLNRRLARPVYEQVHSVTRTENGLTLDGDGEVVDAVLKMRRIPADRFWDHLLDAGQLGEADLDALVATLVPFYQESPRHRDDSYGTAETVGRLILGTFDLPEVVTAFLDRDAFHAQEERIRRFLDLRGGMLRRRKERGAVRDCHGDLRLEHICRGPLFGADLLVYDCIEFNDNYRIIDVAADIAFLAMEFTAAGHPEFARLFLQKIVRALDDPEIWSVLQVYLAYRAMVRCKVEALTAHGCSDATEAESHRERARGFLAQAGTYHLPAQQSLTLMTGLPGCGKTTVAHEAALHTGAAVLSSDAIRKELAGISTTTRHEGGYEEGIYSPEFSRKTFDELFSRAETLLRAGASVILDATFLRREYRRRAEAIAAKVHVPYRIIEVELDEETTIHRLNERARANLDASDADLGVFREKQHSREPLTPSERERSIRIRTDSSGWEALPGVIAELRQVM